MAVPFFGVALIRMIGLWTVMEKSGRSFCLKMSRSPSTDKNTSTGTIVFVCGKICLLTSCIMPAFYGVNSKMLKQADCLFEMIGESRRFSGFWLLTLGYS